MKLYEWYKVAGISFWAMEEGKLVEADVAEKKIGLLKRGDTVYAFTAACPHAGARLCDGWVDALGRIVCPDHKYRFDPVNGRNTTGEGYKLFTYPVELREGEVYLGLIVNP